MNRISHIQNAILNTNRPPYQSTHRRQTRTGTVIEMTFGAMLDKETKKLNDKTA